MNKEQLNVAFLNVAALNRMGLYRGKKLVQTIWEDLIVSGADILTVMGTKENSLKSLVVNGGCVLNDTQTPLSPVAIKCNIGDISYGVLGNNLLEVNDANIVIGKYINNNGVITESLPNIYFQRFVAVKPLTEYTLSTSEHINYANFMEYDENGVFIKRTLYGSTSAYVGTSVTHTMGDTTAFVIVGSNVNSSKYPTITKADVKSIKWMFNEGSSSLPYEEYRCGYSYNGEDKVFVYNKNLSVGELVGKGYASTGVVSTSTTFCGNLYRFPVTEGQTYTVSWGELPDGMSGVFVNTWNLDGSWRTRQAISATDKLSYTIPSGVGMVNFTLYKTGGITIGPDTWIQVEYGNTATEYVPAVAPVSASAELLLGVDDYIDKQDAVSGTVTHRVGIKVLNGTENISTSNRVFTIGISDKVRSKSELACSHFVYSSDTSSVVSDLKIISFASQNIGFRYDACTDIESFRQFLQREYAKGTPVMVVYPLAEEYTESVAPQSLANPKGDITVIRDAKIDGLSMEVTCSVKSEKPEETPSAPKEITFNAYIITGGGGGGVVGGGVQENQTFTALDGMTWKEYIDSDYGSDSPFFYYEGAGVFISDGSPWLPQEYGIFLDGVFVRDNDKIIANAQYNNNAPV